MLVAAGKPGSLFAVAPSLALAVVVGDLAVRPAGEAAGSFTTASAFAA
jgi:hypothetical protein